MLDGRLRCINSRWCSRSELNIAFPRIRHNNKMFEELSFYSRYQEECSEERIEPSLKFEKGFIKDLLIAEPSRFHDYRYKLEPIICDTSKLLIKLLKVTYH